MRSALSCVHICYLLRPVLARCCDRFAGCNTAAGGNINTSAVYQAPCKWSVVGMNTDGVAGSAGGAGAAAGGQGQGGPLQPKSHQVHDGHAAPTQLHGQPSTHAHPATHTI